jgi:hypothetical protein
MKFAIAILGALMILAIFQMQNSGAGNQPPMSSAVGGSPWDSLSATEIEQAAAAVKARHGNDVLFNRISLQQPLKRQALSWQPRPPPRDPIFPCRGTIPLRAIRLFDGYIITHQNDRDWPAYVIGRR